MQGTSSAPHREYHCDVLVIGSGGAGFTAAITAAAAGLKVLLTELVCHRK